MNIHELRQEATRYYDNAPRRIQGLVHRFFDAMDTNGDGGVDFYEIHDFLQGRRFLTRFLNRSVFNELDEDGDRSLDFYEFITFFYMIFMMFDCDECDRPLVGQRHYTCEVCFTSPHPNSTPYNVCGSCYNRGYFRHQNHRPVLVDYRAMILEGAGRSGPTPRGGYRGRGGGYRGGGGGGGYRGGGGGGGYRGGGGGGGYSGGGYLNASHPPVRTITRRRETFGEIIEFLDGAHTVYELAGAAAACNIM